MGSCVSHCSRQDVVHQQTGRVITDVQKSIEISPGSSLLQKTFAELRDVKDSASEDKESKNTLASVAPESNDVRVQINNEIRALREQLVRSQVVFTYLLKNEENRSKSCDGKNEIRSLLDGGNLSEIFHCKSFDGQVLARFYNRSNRSSSSYTSHRSTPMHCGYTSISCPTLPIDSPVVTKSTQTEPVSGVFIDQAQSEQNILINSITKRTSSPPSTPCGTVSETFLLSDICEIHKEPEDHSFPRHRTNSFLAAVKDGNPKLVNAEFNFHSDMKQIPSETNDCVQKRNEVSHFLLFNQSSSNNIPSSSKIYDLEGKSMTDETKECTFPRKLSVLLEEDFEDSPRNYSYFSVCSSQPYLNKRRKMPHSCDVKTQTDLSISEEPPRSKSPANLPITEVYYPRHGFTLVSQAVQKKTVHSMELPKKLVLRYPPPYMQKNIRHSYASSNFRHHPLHHKWATVSDSLPSKSEYSLSHLQDNSKLQTRHLSLEKQESFSSYEHASCVDSRMSSTTDCSGWMTKSDVDLNLKIEPPSYQQSLLASQGGHKNRLETVSSETKSPTGREEKIPPRPNVLERAKSDSDAKLIDDKSIKNFKCSQRSFRRSSGTGSPNSQLPRYPAFDFSEQEDIHSLLPSPSEPEATMKREAQSTHKSDDYQHNRLHLKNSSNKKQDSNKSKTLMPELMENSETESTKGSFECEALDIPPYSDINSLPVPDIAFPSLPNTFLAKLGVHKDSPLPVEAFDEQELESKFIALSLAFKTDRPTLSKRLELHKRQRDMAEKNVENEFQAMRDHLMTLNLKATSSDVRDLITKIQNHLDIAQQATSRVSGRSETYGAVQQEERVSRAFEVLVLHVDHLKRLFDKEHKELEETRKMLTDTRIFRKDVNSDVIPEDQKKYSKTFGLPVGSIKSVGRRRASVAEFQQRSFLDNCKTPGFSQSWTSGLTMRKVETKQQVPSYSAVSTVDVNSVVPDNDSSPNRTHTSEINVRRCSLPSASPNIQTSPKESTPVSFPKNLSVKPERNIWTRKLSAVTDEKEQSEDEAPKSDEALSKQHHESVQFLLQVQKNTLYQMKDESPLELVDLSDDSSEEVSYAGNIVNIIKNSEIGKYLNSSNALWQQNNTWTLMRYFCSGILLFVSLCILISMILSWGGIYLSFIMDFCFTLITYIIY
ncbi:uncharacterized protein [Parasteatoda tepidariorum]|uniref:uncharacterized protein isoform X2 n=1 Tax=Parasteatoda tepidariorum TaxID=114398 RepID=UPI001C718CD5|nr:uncharacterized protein LOC107453359 isoform X2 [Parasteatoda tepidariorum]